MCNLFLTTRNNYKDAIMLQFKKLFVPCKNILKLRHELRLSTILDLNPLPSKAPIKKQNRVHPIRNYFLKFLHGF